MIRLAVILLLVLGCTSRYRMDLYLEVDNERKRVKVVGTEFVLRASLPVAVDQQLVAGNGNCVIVETQTRGMKTKSEGKSALTFDEVFTSRMYIQLPATLLPEKHQLVDSSLLFITSRYEKSSEEKRFAASSGHVIVDSLTGEFMFLTINGTYLNPVRDSLKVDGRCKVRVAR